ncbi:MAG: helix-turn-helix domain-containing protein [Patescibacteria group bacterium]
MAQWQKLLRSLGFTESEANIYLVSLEMGPSPVQDIAKKAKVSRVTTYAAIESLIKNGLMSSVQKGKKNLYAAESPDRLLHFVSGRIKTMEATLKEVESSVQDLKLLQRGDKPVVKLFEGEGALKALQEDMLKTPPAATYEEFGNIDEIERAYDRQQHLNPFHDEFAKIKQDIRLVYLSKHKPGSNEPKSGKTQNVKGISLPPEKYDFGGDVIVYGNKIALSTFRGKQISVIVESEELAKTMRAMFQYMWSHHDKK